MQATEVSMPDDESFEDTQAPMDLAARLHIDSEPSGLVPALRRPVVNRDLSVYGYEITRMSSSAPVEFSLPYVQERAGGLGRGFLGRHKLFLSCGLAQILKIRAHEAKPEKIIPGSIVLRLPSLRGIPPSILALIFESLAFARRSGFAVAFDADALTRNPELSHTLADYIFIETAALEDVALRQLLKVILKTGHAQPIAADISTQNLFARSLNFGISLSAGHAHIEPVFSGHTAVSPSLETTYQLIDLAQRDAELFEFEPLLRREPKLSYTLLRYVNASGIGLGTIVSSFSQALMVLGMKGLSRLCMLLVAAPPGALVPGVVSSTAIIRGRLMESLARISGKNISEEDAFVVGVFSLLESITGVRLALALQSVPLSKHVKATLLPGPAAATDEWSCNLGKLLKLAVSLEMLSVEGNCASDLQLEIENSAGELGISVDALNDAHVEALEWTDALMAPPSAR